MATSRATQTLIRTVATWEGKMQTKNKNKYIMTTVSDNLAYHVALFGHTCLFLIHVFTERQIIAVMEPFMGLVLEL